LVCPFIHSLSIYLSIYIIDLFIITDRLTDILNNNNNIIIICSVLYIHTYIIHILYIINHSINNLK
ncbi:hypothetical protein SAMD00019534_041710, partial [Acytostelium subglobosum LB1]|uniref:hypothetical protein n=1 Tax=Acytostelium subglobosum LB1 TaxID=1410327 RepID=UPI000644F171